VAGVAFAELVDFDHGAACRWGGGPHPVRTGILPGAPPFMEAGTRRAKREMRHAGFPVLNFRGCQIAICGPKLVETQSHVAVFQRSLAGWH
jgi:hypothetical protein